MNKIKKMLAVFMAGAMLMAGGVLPQENADAEGEVDYGIRNPRIENGVTTWDKIKFGSYYQDAEVQPAEPIKWRVLSVDGDDAFLLADKILDCKQYNGEWKGVTWETCTLRKWLNNDFYNEAFDDEEKKAVMETTVVNENNPYYDTDGGNDTKDKVYLLSIAEASNTGYGFGMLGIQSETREARSTDYAKINNVLSNSNGFGYWWLRSPGENSNNYNPSNVNNSGYVNFDGFSLSNRDYGVRPALHVNLSSSKVMDAGKVDSEGNVTMLGNGISNPVVRDGVATWDCVYFGNYKQNCTFKKQDIEWRVLSVDGDDAFLLADENLDCKPYNEKFEDVTWETCTLRKWLNEDFYNEAFNDEEKKAVRETMVVNEDNSSYDTKGGNDTTDKIYLLSMAEASDAAYGFDTKFKEDSKTREARNTDYAKVNGLETSTSDDTVGKGSWWLRSPGCYYDYDASYVFDNGYGYDAGINKDYGVRPALQINLSSSLWSKVDEQENEKPTLSSMPTNEPTKKPTSTDKPTTPTEATQTSTAVAQPTPSVVATQNPTPMVQPVLKQFKLSSVKCTKNTKKITGKVSVSKPSIKIKVGKKAYKKATVKGKNFTLKLNYKLKKKTKIIIKVEKKGYKSLMKSYKVK